MEYEVDESEETVDILEIRMAGYPVGVTAIARESGTVYLSGEVHPAGAFACLMLAAKEHVPYVSTSAVNALFPADWIAAACLHDMDRLRVIANLIKFTRESEHVKG